MPDPTKAEREAAVDDARTALDAELLIAEPSATFEDDQRYNDEARGLRDAFERAARAAGHAEAEARAFFADHELVEAHHAISFLRDCLKGEASHSYPEQTEQELRNIEALVELPEGCFHAVHNHDDCTSCVASRQRWDDARHHAETLGWPVEAGRWPRPAARALSTTEEGSERPTETP